MHTAKASFSQQHDNIFGVLGMRARAMSARELGALALVSGVVALASTLAGQTSWMLLAACYVVWDFVGWGLLLGRPHQTSLPWRAFEYFVVGTGTVVAIAVVIGIFFFALGPRWVL